MEKRGYVYILTNKRRTVLYVGVTSNLVKRMWEHKHKLVPGFTKYYSADVLVYYEVGESILAAIEREKQLKGGSRLKKVQLIDGMNPDWKDLTEHLRADLGIASLRPAPHVVLGLRSQ